jgi:hypothetical protein
MAQAIETEIICDGRYRIQSIKAIGRRRGRIIEIEDIDCRLQYHGTASKLTQMASKLRARPRFDLASFIRRIARPEER